MRKKLLNTYNIYLVVVGSLSTLPILAPIFVKLSESFAALEIPARFLYLFYSITCHQFHHRSIHLFDYQYAWCARDTGIWLGIFSAAVAVKYFGIKKVSPLWVLPFIVPIALDGGIQTIATMLEIAPGGISGDPVYVSNNLVRFITGSIFGIGISIWISSSVADSVGLVPRKLHLKFSSKVKKITSSINTFPRQVSLLISILFVTYFVMVSLWGFTSTQYKPSDLLDTAVKTPVIDFYGRRKNAICPTTEKDLFRFDCFFSYNK